VKVLEVRTEGGHRLVRLRNPWSTSNWQGKWADASSNWTPELRERLQVFLLEDEAGDVTSFLPHSTPSNV
jgi:hypothetical protein